MIKAKKKVLLIILDGVGCNKEKKYNALAKASIPYMSALWKTYPHTTLSAHGPMVGLPENQMGSSETGHSIIGSGQIISHDLMRINRSIDQELGGSDESKLKDNEILISALAKAKNKIVHICGLLSDGGVHSHINHLLHLIEICHDKNIASVIHVITDGRDTPPKSAINYLTILEEKCKKYNAVIGSVAGRYYTMDRDNRKERIELGLQALFSTGEVKAENWRSGVEQAYSSGLTDEFIIPFSINGLSPSHILNKESTLLLFNFRSDRMRQISDELSYKLVPKNIVSATEYSDTLNFNVLFPTLSAKPGLGELVSQQGWSQLRCAESEKFAHVTYFFNNGKNEPFEKEERVIIASPKVASYDLAPEMSANQVSSVVESQLNSQKHSLIVVNYANGDMVGHTAVQEAIIKAVECLDAQLKKVIDCAKANGYTCIVTADHGNCDEMVDEQTGEPHTQHSLHPVPFILVDDEVKQLVDCHENRGLASIAPTICTLLGLKIPKYMQEKSLIEEV